MIPGQAIRLANSSVSPWTSPAVPAPTPTTSPEPTSTSPTTPDLDRQNPPTSATDRRPTPTTTATSISPRDLQVQHDVAFASLLAALGANLKSGDERKFLMSFAAPLTSRVGHWFGNTRALGVAAVRLAPADDYSTNATDSAASFTRTFVLGVRTPYDDGDAISGMTYSATVSIKMVTGRSVLTITSWGPTYLADPMNCDCTLSVFHTGTTAVIAAAADPDLMYWAPAALGAAADGITWSHGQLAGTGLAAPKGQVIFLADKPFHWFLNISGPAQRSNVTAGLVDATGDYPATRYSDQSRIVLMLQAADGSIVPNNAEGREYAADVITHESTHQLMNRNSLLPSRTPDSPPTWVVEGIAVAVETLFRDSLGDSGDIGYPEPNDPKNIDPHWFVDHLTEQMPTRAQLYASSADDAPGYYAISGSVFRYIEREYGYLTMMKVAKTMYSKVGQNPFAYFPDPDHAGSYLPAAAAKTLWKNWFVYHYE